MAVGRNRVIYQSEALLYSPLATGSNTGTNRPSGIKRVQSANYSFTLNRQDVNQFGELGRIDSVLLESPTVSLDFSYYPLSGDQEKILGFNGADHDQSFLSGIFTNRHPDYKNREQKNGGNYYIVTSTEGTDAFLGTSTGDFTTIGIGNAEITDYTFDASVGALPTVSITAEGMNILAVTGLTGNYIPSVSPEHGGFVTGAGGVPASFEIREDDLKAYSEEASSKFAALRPGDITLNINDAAFLTKQVDGSPDTQRGQSRKDDNQAAHIQSFSINVPMSRTVLQRLGSNYGYARVLDVPMQGSFTVNAIVSEIKQNNMLDWLCEGESDVEIGIWKPACYTGNSDYEYKEKAMSWAIKNVELESEAISSSIGDNKTVDLTFTYQVAGPTDTTKGIFFSGAAY